MIFYNITVACVQNPSFTIILNFYRSNSIKKIAELKSFSKLRGVELAFHLVNLQPALKVFFNWGPRHRSSAFKTIAVICLPLTYCMK